MTLFKTNLSKKKFKMKIMTLDQQKKSYRMRKVCMIRQVIYKRIQTLHAKFIFIILTNLYVLTVIN